MRLASNANTDKTVITMSRKEFFRLHILIGMADGRTRVDDAGTPMVRPNAPDLAGDQTTQ
jgi:hypothetical protein